MNAHPIPSLLRTLWQSQYIIIAWVLRKSEAYERLRRLRKMQSVRVGLFSMHNVGRVIGCGKQTKHGVECVVGWYKSHPTIRQTSPTKFEVTHEYEYVTYPIAIFGKGVK